jgi:hypothetical protein
MLFIYLINKYISLSDICLPANGRWDLIRRLKVKGRIAT